MTGTTRTPGPEVPRAAVVVGVDGTESSLHAADWAAEHADLEGLPLVVAHVVDDTAVEATAWAGVMWVLPTPLDRLMAAGRQVVEEATDRVSRRHPDLAVHPHAVHGDVRRTLVDDTALAATAWSGVTWVLPTPLDRLMATGRRLVEGATDRVSRRHPDLAVHPHAVHGDVRRTLVDLSRDASTVVLGSRGRGTLGSAVLGSVGAHVTRHARCSVVVCRPGHPGRVHDGVLVVSDGTPTGEPIVVRSLEIAAERGLPLTVLRCVASESEAPIAHTALEQELAPLRARFPSVPVRAEVFAGDLDAALAARPRPADLVVVGRHPVDSLARQLAHVNATRVLEHAESPVLVVPQAG